MPRELRATALGVGSATACLLAELCRDGAPSPSHDLEWIYVGDAPEKQLGPLSFHSKPPGYLEIATPLWLAPIDPCIESRALVLRSDGSPRGTLSLVFRGGELWERWRGAASDAAFALDLIDREGGGHYEVHRLDARSDASVEHVPIGSYTLALRGSGNFFELPRDAPIELEIRAGSTTTIEVDVGELGGLRLIAPELGGVVLRETVQLALRRLPKRNVATANLVGRDLVWLALAPGDYEVVVNGGSFGRALELGSVTIAPGELATIALPAR